MRYAIFGDIHGNTEALTAVFGDIEKSGVDRLLCLGDIVGYGAEPRECLRAIGSRGIDTVMGNHDSAAIGETPLDYFNDYARAAIEWTAGVLSGGEKAHLKRLPLVRDCDGFTLVHSSLSHPEEWGYILTPGAAELCFAKLRTAFCFIGHSHVPGFFEKDGAHGFFQEGRVEAERGGNYIVNVGSVGQPRDGDPRASYGIYDAGKNTVEIRRVGYDIAGAQAKIRNAGLPEFLAMRLERGR